MKKTTNLVLLQALCVTVISVACVGVFATGAWAFNTQTFRTPTETLEMGTFSVCVDDKVPDENGTYNLGEGEYSIILHAYGNMPAFVLTRWTPEGEEAQQYIVWLDPTWEEDSYVEISVSTYKSMTLTLTPIAEWPETGVEIPEKGIVVEAPMTEEENTQQSETTSATNGLGETAAENGQSQVSTAETPTTSEPPATGEPSGTNGETAAGTGQLLEPAAEPSEPPVTSAAPEPEPSETPTTGGESTTNEPQATEMPQPQAAEGADSPGETGHTNNEESTNPE